MIGTGSFVNTQKSSLDCKTQTQGNHSVLKLLEKVSFYNIASGASYVYFSFTLRSSVKIERRNLGHFWRENSNETILMILKHGECELTLSVYHGCGLFYHLAKKRLNIIHLPVALAKFMMVDAW